MRKRKCQRKEKSDVIKKEGDFSDDLCMYVCICVCVCDRDRLYVLYLHVCISVILLKLIRMALQK